MTQKVKPKLRNIDLLNALGHFIFIIGVCGFALNIAAPEIGFARGLGLAAASAGMWVGPWLMASLVPPTVLTVCWALAAAAIGFIAH